MLPCFARKSGSSTTSSDEPRGKVMVPPLNRFVSFEVVKRNGDSMPASGAQAPNLLESSARDGTKVQVKWNVRDHEIAMFQTDKEGANQEEVSNNQLRMVRQRTCSRGNLNASCCWLPLPAYDDGQDIEYFSATHQQWLNGIVHSEAYSGGGQIAGATVLTTVSLCRGGQIRENTGLDLLRSPLKPGELVEMISGGKRLAATIAPDQLVPRPLMHGYRVVLDGTREVLDNVAPIDLKRRFPRGQSVEVYRGPHRGWQLTKIHQVGTADGCGAEAVSLSTKTRSIEHHLNQGEAVDVFGIAPPCGHQFEGVAPPSEKRTASELELWTLIPVCTGEGQDSSSPEWLPSYFVCPAVDTRTK